MSQPAGTAVAVLATLGYVDREGDLILPGSLVNGPNDLAAVSRGEHAVLLGNEEPVGEARLYEADGRLFAEVRYYDEGPNDA